MQLSKRSEYALRTLLVMSRHSTSQIHTLQELSKAEGIPPKFLEQILAQLKKAGVLHSRRGSQGGYSLARPPSRIMVGEILELIEGTRMFAPAERGAISQQRNVAILRSFQLELEKEIYELIYHRSLEDLLKLDPHRAVMNFEI
ncbi:MAG: Rrf2 family transcriptional regulator [Chthoniobacterales bacterium]